MIDDRWIGPIKNLGSHSWIHGFFNFCRRPSYRKNMESKQTVARVFIERYFSTLLPCTNSTFESLKIEVEFQTLYNFEPFTFNNFY